MSEAGALFPPVEPYDSGFLDVGDGHRVYWERVGTPGARPVLAVHGGPGSGASPQMRRLFDPAKFDVYLFDQRGCGRSTPHACLEANTTHHLLRDMELLRTQVARVDRWMVFGGSWGSLLSLAYAQQNPTHVDALVLRGIFMCSQPELDWFYGNGARSIFPDKWERFVAPVEPAQRNDLLAAYARLLNDPDPAVHLPAAKAWCEFEDEISTMASTLERTADQQDHARQLAVSRLENHYFRHAAFLAPGQLLSDVSKLRHLPATLVHGRYDMVCPLRFAWELKQAWPAAKMVVVEMTGHSISSPPMLAAVMGAIDTCA